MHIATLNTTTPPMVPGVIGLDIDDLEAVSGGIAPLAGLALLALGLGGCSATLKGSHTTTTTTGADGSKTESTTTTVEGTISTK